MIEELIQKLRQAKIHLEDRELADMLWLGRFLPSVTIEPEIDSNDSVNDSTSPFDFADSTENKTSTSAKSDLGADTIYPPTTPSARPSDKYPIYTPDLSVGRDNEGKRASAIRVPGAAALPNALEISRALRPFTRRWKSGRGLVLDEEETVQRSAETRFRYPVFKPALERWFDVALVVEDTPSMVVWQQLVRELSLLLERHGAFRDVRVWRLQVRDEKVLVRDASGVARAPESLNDPSSRRLIILLSDCSSQNWRDAAFANVVRGWASLMPVIVGHMLSEKLWRNTALGLPNTSVKASLPGQPNSMLTFELPWGTEKEESHRNYMPLPVLALNPALIGQWATMLMNPGVVYNKAVLLTPSVNPATITSDLSTEDKLTPEQRVQRFQALVSDEAYDLAIYLSVLPLPSLTLPVMRLVQSAMLAHPQQGQIAEVLLGGVVRRKISAEEEDLEDKEDKVEYIFHDDVNQILERKISGDELQRVYQYVPKLIEQRIGTPFNFTAFLENPEGEEVVTHVATFVSLARDVLRRLGISHTSHSKTRYTGVDERIAESVEAILPNATLPKMPPGQEIIQPPPKTFEIDELYVFISYARPDQAIAEKVEAFLTAAGVRVFRDARDIGVGDNWDLTIEQALNECQRMVLLLSASSMPYRKEVHREWFYFDWKRKPIYSLFIQNCELHSRFFAYNYIDARSDLSSALERLRKELGREFYLPEPMTVADRVSVYEGVEAEAHTVPQALDVLYEAIRNPESSVVLPVNQAVAIRDHNPGDLKEFHLGRLAEWSLPRFQINKRFANLTLLLDRGEREPQRWQRESYRFNDLRDVLKKTEEHPALVLLGAPGSGKSTLLRRLQLDHSMDCLRDEADTVEQISFFVPLNSYRARGTGEPPKPREWLITRWTAAYPQLPSLESLLQKGRVLLLLDALNEMPHRSVADYHTLVGQWRSFVQEVVRQGNRIVFSCRSLDYSASLSSPELRVPQVEVQPMSPEQVREFLKVYTPTHAERVWKDLDASPRFELFRTPYFLKLLCEQVEATGDAPKGPALFTGFVRQALKREINGELFQPSSGLLGEADHVKLSLNKWRGPFELPERGVLIPKLSDLAFTMQKKGLETEGAQVRIDYEDACDLIAHEQADKIIKAGIALNILDKDFTQFEIVFFHRLLQEYFAARRLAREPNPVLMHVEWEAEKARPAIAETLAELADGDPLPPLPQTGWEETTLTAAPMAKDPAGFIRDLIPHNLPLTARCAASPEVKISDELKREIQNLLIERTQDQRADLRARIAAGEALGLIGDPRFELRHGTHGDYLLPPLVTIPGGKYPMGVNKSEYEDEKPAHTVELPAFQIGQFPVTNAEYKLFMEAKGYENEHWWDTSESLAWRSGEASSEGAKQSWRDTRETLRGWSDDGLRGLVKQNRITSKQADDWITIRNWSDEEFEQWLEEQFPSGELYRQPRFWDDTRFSNPAQPVVGVTWFEARAYCNWLTVNVAGTKIYRLLTETEFEAAARGKKGRLFPYGDKFDASRCNTFESHIRRTTPVGILDNATPEGAFDLSGNAFTWTLSIYDQEKFPYPYRSDDGREDILATGVRRVLRGDSWSGLPGGTGNARATWRESSHPTSREDYVGFRLVVERPILL